MLLQYYPFQKLHISIIYTEQKKEPSLRIRDSFTGIPHETQTQCMRENDHHSILDTDQLSKPGYIVRFVKHGTLNDIGVKMKNINTEKHV